MSLGDIAAKLNVPVFPCDAGKRPVIANGFKGAVTDPAHIKAAFDRPGAEMIGVPTGLASGWVVVDVDIKNGAQGRVWLDENADALPPTRTHKTRSGGLHLIFQNPPDIQIRNSASRIAPGIDVRGEGGYVIVPPSDGYTVADATEPAEMPLWLIRACLPPARPEPAAYVAAPRTRSGGTPYGLQALDNECRDISCAPDGRKHELLNKGAYSIGGLVSAGEIEQAVAWGSMKSALEVLRPRCEDFRSAERTLSEAFTAGMARPRAVPERHPMGNGHAPEPPLHEGDAQPSSTQEDKSEKAKPGLPLLWFSDIEPVLDVKDFVQGVLIEQGASVVYGESNAGKTFWTTDLALHVAAGDSWCGKRVEQGGVVYCVLEGGIGFKNRVAAWKKARGLESHPIPFVAIPSGLNLLDPLADTPKLTAAITAAAAIMGVPVKLVVIDTLSRALAGGNENAPEDMGALVMNMDTIRKDTQSAVLFVHHCGKDQAKGARGHSLLRAAIDTEIEVIADEESDAKTATIVKQRDLPKGDHYNFKLKVIELGQNRHGEPVTTCTVDYGDKAAPAVTRAPRGSGGNHQQRALEILADLIATSGQPGHGAPHGIVSVPDQWWRERFYERAMAGAEQDTKKRAFRRAADLLVERHQVGLENGRVWLGRKPSSEGDYSS